MINVEHQIKTNLIFVLIYWFTLAVKVHLTPKFFFLLKRVHLLFKLILQKIFEFGWILNFPWPAKVMLEMFHDRVLGSLGRARFNALPLNG